MAVFRQYMQYGYWKVLVIRNHRYPASVRHVIPALFIFSLSLLLIAGLAWWPALWAAAALAGTYILAVIFRIVDDRLPHAVEIPSASAGSVLVLSFRLRIRVSARRSRFCGVS